MASSTLIRSVYRDLVHVAKQNSTASSIRDSLQEIRTKFRRPVAESETIASRLKEAQNHLSFLRISSVKIASRPRGGGGEQAGKWVYRNGERLENVAGTLRDSTGRVVSSYDGKNLDPESVTRHRKSLKRAGFTNNAHAKGIF